MRIRSRNKRPHTGSRMSKAYGRNNPWTTSLVVEFDTEYCEDLVHPYPYVAEGPLYLRELLHKPSRVNGGLRCGLDPSQRAAAYCYKSYPVIGNNIHLPSSGVNWNRLEIAALSNVQDSAPIVDLPLGIAELKDFPRLLKSVAQQGKRLAASPEGFLTWQWALRPMLNDLVSAVRLQKAIAQRVKDHTRKHRTKRASGRLPTEVYLDDPGSLTFNQSIGGSKTCWGDYSVELSKAECWFTARIEPLIELDELLAQSVSYRHSYGFGRDGVNAAYNLMPWSWLIDYFSTLGSLIELRHNQMPYEVKSVCLMARSEILRKVTVMGFANGTTEMLDKSTKGSLRVVEKRRKVVYNPIGRLVVDPILSQQQLLNLAALGAVFGKHAARLR